MIKRPDVDILSKAVAKGRFSTKDAGEWIKLPFIDLPKRGTVTGAAFLSYYDRIGNELTKLNAEGKFGVNDIRDYFRQEGRMFHSFILHGTVTGDFMRVDIHDDETIDFTGLSDDRVMWVPNAPLPKLRIQPVAEEIEGGMALGHQLLGSYKQWVEKTILITAARNQAVAETAARCFKNYLEFLRFCDYSEENDRYAVSVTTQRKPKVSSFGSLSARLTANQGASVIYLDRLPSTGGEATGEGSEKRPHQRRGTWVTLRAERYRYHPKYQVEKGVYRKPAWVGPKEAIVEGNIYTILE